MTHCSQNGYGCRISTAVLAAISLFLAALPRGKRMYQDHHVGRQ